MKNAPPSEAITTTFDSTFTFITSQMREQVILPSIDGAVIKY